LAHLCPTGILQGADIRSAGHVFTFDRELFAQGQGCPKFTDPGSFFGSPRKLRHSSRLADFYY
jgi:hypothetical protein